MESCVQFGVAAIRHHVTVSTVPPACQGLTPAQIDFAAGTALRSAAAGAPGKVAERERIGKASHFLAHMFVAVPAQRGKPAVTAPSAGRISRTALGLTALCSWLITVALGLAMMARWILRSRVRHGPASRLRRPPALNFAHLGLASAGLLIWIAYLATGTTGLAWTASALLLLVTGLGMALIFVPHPASSARGVTAQTVRAAASDPGPDGASRSRRSAVFTIGAHIIFATVTILFAFLTAVGTG